MDKLWLDDRDAILLIAGSLDGGASAIDEFGSEMGRPSLDCCSLIMVPTDHLREAIDSGYNDRRAKAARIYLQAASKFEEARLAGKISAQGWHLTRSELDNIPPVAWSIRGAWRQYDGIRYARAEIARWLEPAAAVAERSGAPGRPTRMHLVVAEFERRVAAGRFEMSLAAEARHLRSWLVSTHPDGPNLTNASIETGIRKRYNAAKAARSTVKL